jgi:hypothetical protein
MAQAMGYGGLWVMRGRFWCKFGFGSRKNLWVMGGYGLQEVWVMRGSTVRMHSYKQLPDGRLTRNQEPRPRVNHGTSCQVYISIVKSYKIFGSCTGEF